MDILKILDGTPEPPIIDLGLEKTNDSGDYHLATPMYEFQKELTDQIVSLHYPDILKYCETNDTNNLIIKSLEICINNCMLVSTHPYLLINHYMPKNLALKDMLSKLAETSGKFEVLRDLANVIIQNTSKHNKSIAVVMNNNVKFFDLTEALLLGCTGNKSIRRYVGNSIKKDASKPGKSNTNSTTFHLIPHDGKLTKDEELFQQLRPDLIIVFDSNVDTTSDFFRKLRVQNRRTQATIIRTIPMRTVEHCQLFHSSDKHEAGYLYKLISSIVCLRESIGVLSPDLFPIYKQHLQYLSHTFFDQMFQNTKGSSFSPWPLPDLPNIPNFNATDVERSLLTEVKYHYTPYDSVDDGSSMQKKQTKRQSYYEFKRLELDYVTNPLKNDMNTLIGIFGSHHRAGNTRDEINKNFLTHSLITRFKTAYLNWDRVQEEYKSYSKQNSEEVQNGIGRRETELKQVLSKILADIEHSESRISSADKKIDKKRREIDNIKQHNIEIENSILHYLEEKGITDEKLVTFYNNQVRIWELQDQISNTINRLKLKQEEKSYMSQELSNANTSIQSSNNSIEATTESNRGLKRKIEELNDTLNTNLLDYGKNRDSIKKEIEEARKVNQLFKAKLGKSFKFLKETSHLKKRKLRGVTPNSK